MDTALPITRDVLHGLTRRFGQYWKMTKSLQTGLLVFTALAGYVSGCCLNLSAASLAALVGSMFLAVSGSTILNMVYDRDVDSLMNRTAGRPLPSGLIPPGEAAAAGVLLTFSGLAWSFLLSPLYGLVVLAGVALDVFVYTFWLKRRSAFSILFGGVAGGMPLLAGRALATGTIDLVGGLLALGILLWIPLHILSFAIRNHEDYARAGIPTLSGVYGLKTARVLIALSIISSSGAIIAACWLLGLGSGWLIALGILGGALSIPSLACLLRRQARFEFWLYKGASVFMLFSMLVIVINGL